MYVHNELIFLVYVHVYHKVIYKVNIDLYLLMF
jgi:hypothetical protein